MGRRGYLFLSGILGVLVGAAVLMSCSQKELSNSMFRANPKARAEGASEPGRKEVSVLEELKPAYFEYNKADLTSDAKEALKENAVWLKHHPKVQVQIEGHCDERGTREFNYKLGERRALVAKQYLVSHGVEAGRIETVSYGALSGQNEKTWKNNRRAVFVLIYPKVAE